MKRLLNKRPRRRLDYRLPEEVLATPLQLIVDITLMNAVPFLRRGFAKQLNLLARLFSPSFVLACCVDAQIAVRISADG